MTNAKPTKTALKTLERIARDELDLETLETRKWDSYDFKEHAVWSIKRRCSTPTPQGSRRVKPPAQSKTTNPSPGTHT